MASVLLVLLVLGMILLILLLSHVLSSTWRAPKYLKGRTRRSARPAVSPMTERHTHEQTLTPRDSD